MAVDGKIWPGFGGSSDLTIMTSFCTIALELSAEMPLPVANIWSTVYAAYIY